MATNGFRDRRGGRALRLAALAALLYAARRYCRDWGTSKDEARARLPGDEVIAGPVVTSTKAMPIDAPPAAVWPWLVQLGQDRGGLYLPEPLGNLVGLAFRNADQIHPPWQHLGVGDTVQLAERGWLGRSEPIRFSVVEIVPEDRIVLHASPPQLPWDAVWSFHLLPRWGDRSRLLLRARSGLRRPGQVIVMELARPATTFGMRLMLRGIRRRAERHRPVGGTIAQTG